MALKLYGHKDTTVGPYTRCVFCDGDGDGKPLTDEHAIPAALGGRLVLKRATCVRCRDITAKFESKCLNGMFAPVRLYYGFTAARGKMDHPRLPVDVYSPDKGQHTIRVGRGSHPTIWTLPEFYSPTEMSGQKHKDTLLCRRRITYFTQETVQNAQGLLKNHKATQIRTRTKNEDIEFARMLAKIAHCHGIAALGLDRFRPLLNEAILSADGKTVSRYIGCVGRVPPPLRRSGVGLHHEFAIRVGGLSGIARGILVLEMDLFVGFPEAPTYVACFGETNPLTWQRLQSQSAPGGI